MKTPLPARKDEVLGGLVVLAISNPSTRRPLASAFRGREKMLGLAGVDIARGMPNWESRSA